MKIEIEFVMWLAQNQPDCLHLHALDSDWGRKQFEVLHKHFLDWRGQPHPEEAVLNVMQKYDDRLAENDYNIGFLNGMETILAELQERQPNLIPSSRLKRPSEALREKDFAKDEKIKKEGLRHRGPSLG